MKISSPKENIILPNGLKVDYIHTENTGAELYICDDSIYNAQGERISGIDSNLNDFEDEINEDLTEWAKRNSLIMP